MKIDIEEVIKNLDCVKDMELNKWAIEHMDNAIKALEQQQDEIEELKDKVDSFYGHMYYAIADMRHVGCLGKDTSDSMRNDLHEKFNQHHKQLKEFCNIED